MFLTRVDGTTGSFLQFGATGPRVRNSSGAVEARNNADSAYANFAAALITANATIASSVPLTLNGSSSGQSGNFLELKATGGTVLSSFSNIGYLRISNVTPLQNAPIFATATANSYVQVAIQNTSTGTTASTDFVATANDGTDTTYYANLGINGSGWSNSGEIGGAHDSYLTAIGGHLVLGAGTATKYIKFATGGTAPANLRMTLNDTALVMNGVGIQTLKWATFTEYANGTKTANWTLDFNNGQKQSVTMGSSNTISTLTFPGAGNYVLRVTQDATGSRVLTWPAAVKAPGGKSAGLVLSTTANAVDIVSIYYDGSTAWATIAKAFAT